MKKLVTIKILALLLGATLILTSCGELVVGLANLIVELDESGVLETEESEEEELFIGEDTEEENQQPDAEEVLPEEPAPEPAPETVEEPQPAAIALRPWISEIFDQGNGYLKEGYAAMEGVTTESELYMGGIPIVYYSFSNGDGSYFQLVNSSSNLNEIWSSSTSLNERGLPNYNLFPDDFEVDFMFHMASDLFSEVFTDVPDEIAESKSPAVLNEFLGVDVQPIYVPPYEDAVMSKSERWEHHYNISDYTVIMIGHNSPEMVEYAIIYPTSKPPVHATY